jgi:hypothetical protein
LEILQRLSDEDLYLKLEKCEFEKTEIDYLGFTLTPGKIAMDKKKLAGINDWPSPKNLRQVRSWLGFCNFYRRFILNFSKIVKPLTNLTKKDQPFDWSKDCEDAFQTLKKRFQEAPVLVIPDQEEPFFLETDASAYA